MNRDEEERAIAYREQQTQRAAFLVELEKSLRGDDGARLELELEWLPLYPDIGWNPPDEGMIDN